MQSSEDYFHDSTAFEPFFHYSKHDREWARIHPVTRWPHSHGDEHEDALLAIYRGQPAPFDFGVQRVQIPQRLLTDWMGDEGFIRRMYIAMRRPVYYGDFTIYTGEVMKKYREVQTGADEPGGTPGQHEYHAIGHSHRRHQPGRRAAGARFGDGVSTIQGKRPGDAAGAPWLKDAVRQLQYVPQGLVLGG